MITRNKELYDKMTIGMGIDSLPDSEQEGNQNVDKIDLKCIGIGRTN
jgi:hypothetical protein